MDEFTRLLIVINELIEQYLLHVQLLYSVVQLPAPSPCATGVPPERQKVMVAGATLADDDWGKAKSKIKEVRPPRGQRSAE